VSGGTAGHRPDCGCTACTRARGGQEYREALAELEQTRRDTAWAAVMAAGGPDAVMALARQHGDPQRAFRLLEAAGMDAAGILDRYRAEAPYVPQTSNNPSLFANDPEHLAGYLLQPHWVTAEDAEGNPVRQLMPPDEFAYRREVARLTEVKAQEKADRAARETVLWRTGTGEVLREDERARSRVPQHSAVSHEWTDFRDHGGSVA
jgi:hypothetical protein